MSEVNRDHIEMLMKTHKEQVETATRLLGSQNQLIERLETATEKLIGAISTQTGVLDHKIEELGHKMTEQHSDIRNRIYIALVGMITIITTLIGVLWLK